MAPINLTGQLRYDTRGLPEGYDPHHLYEYRLQKRIKEATGLEGYIFQYIPHDLIKSFAIAIDPLSQVKMSLGVITPANRLRYRATASVFDIRRIRHFDANHTYQSYVNWQGIGGNDGPTRDTSSPDNPPWIQGVQTQDALPRTSNDTTRRTRLFGSDTGEFQKFSGFLVSPARQVKRYERVDAVFDINVSPSNPFPSKSGGNHIWEDNIEPSAATLPRSSFNDLRQREIDTATALMQKHVLAMFKDCNPQSRNYSLFRNIVELRDLPRGVLQLQETLRNLKQLDSSLKWSKSIREVVCNLNSSIKDIPNGYLSYHFGWKQTFKDVMDLVVKPAQISKQINLLISRNGKPTTYRTKRSYVSADTGVSGFNYDITGNEEDTHSSSRIERSTELRMVLNTTFSFPVLDIPHLKYDLFTDKLGIYPRFIDIYNLVPWTWLFDWFTGCGNYLEIIENIHHDPSLINWAFLTANVDGRLVTDFVSKSRSSSRYYHNYDDAVVTEVVTSNRHQSSYDYKLQLRRDVSTILEVKTPAKIDSLNLYQQTILGALLLQFSQNGKRSRHTGG